MTAWSVLFGLFGAFYPQKSARGRDIPTAGAFLWGFEFWVLGFGFCVSAFKSYASMRCDTQNPKPKTQNPKLVSRDGQSDHPRQVATGCGESSPRGKRRRGASPDRRG